MSLVYRLLNRDLRHQRRKRRRVVVSTERQDQRDLKASSQHSSGFSISYLFKEDFYADPPLTSTEHKEESAVYDESIPFHLRMETCMQKYRARRNLDSIRNNILTKYLMLGGIDATPRAFTGGLDKETTENSTAEEIRAMTATDFVQSGNKKYYDPEEPEHWVVDFEDVARGFL